MEEKKIKLPRKYNAITKNFRSNSYKNSKISPGIVKKNYKKKSKIMRNDKENTPSHTGTDSTRETYKKDSFIYKKKISQSKINPFCTKNISLNDDSKLNNNKKYKRSSTQNTSPANISVKNESKKYKNLNLNFCNSSDSDDNICKNNFREKIKKIPNRYKLISIKNVNCITVNMCSNNNNSNKNNSITNNLKLGGFDCFNNDFNYNKESQELNENNNKINFSSSQNKKLNEFINIEDLMLLEEKFNDVLKSISNKSNISNECFELINFYNQSSFYNRFENFFKESQSQIIVHTSIMMIIFNIILTYHISFDNSFFNTCCDYLFTIIEMSHNIYLLLCDYISNKVSSSAKKNIWVKKLSLMLNKNLKHLDLNNKDYVSYLISRNLNRKINILSPIFEIKFYIYFVGKYIKVLLKHLDISPFKENFYHIYKDLRIISGEEMNKFFVKKIMRIINKNASVWGNDASLYVVKKSDEIKVPYLEKPNKKKYSLVLDLDETLIFFKIDEKKENRGILKFRPGLDKFLKKVKPNYEIIVFTSSTRDYADPIEDEIENKIKYFDARLYREHTIIYNGCFTKDISRLGRPLDKIIIVDNCPQNFKLQRENGIMIRPFWGEDKLDTALISLGEILDRIQKEFNDVRDGIIRYKDDILNKVSSNFFRKEKNDISLNN